MPTYAANTRATLTEVHDFADHCHAIAPPQRQLHPALCQPIPERGQTVVQPPPRRTFRPVSSAATTAAWSASRRSSRNHTTTGASCVINRMQGRLPVVHRLADDDATGILLGAEENSPWKSCPDSP